MKLAEALLLRADRKRAFEQLRVRIQANARFQEGETPAEDARQLLESASEALDALQGLMRDINRTNSQTRLDDGRSVSDALAERDVLRLRYALLNSAADSASGVVNRGVVRSTRTELKFVSALAVPELRRDANDVARRHRELDALIQQANWTADLIEE